MALFKKSLFAAAILLAGAPLSQASDISLYAGAPLQLTEYNDPIMHILSMENIDVWERIRKGFAIPDLENPLVQTQTTWYSARPDYFERVTVRASRYLYHVVQELEARNMPMELALLPFIESAFNPQALSSANASGMWQFIPSTGRVFNLKQNLFRDERRDVIASTDAALSYLQKLYGMFGDWQLALAAYNWGEGSVLRAIKRASDAGRPTDFNGLSAYMPAETRNYVPKLQAVKAIIATPDRYRVALPAVNNEPYFVSINKTRDIDIKLAAQLAELPMEEFKALNPQFNRPVITGSPTTQILLPKENAERFEHNLTTWGDSLSSWSAHTVTSARERLETIAQKFRTTPELLREVNNIPPRMVLKAGSTILVPKSDPHAQDISLAVADGARLALEPDAPAARRLQIKVAKGDTLSSIARKNRVTVAQIQQWNGLKGTQVQIGQVLALNPPAARVTRVAASASQRARPTKTSTKPKVTVQAGKPRIH